MHRPWILVHSAVMKDAMVGQCLHAAKEIPDAFLTAFKDAHRRRKNSIKQSAAIGARQQLAISLVAGTIHVEQINL
jgi:hypothetical protein